MMALTLTFLLLSIFINKPELSDAVALLDVEGGVSVAHDQLLHEHGPHGLHLVHAVTLSPDLATHCHHVVQQLTRDTGNVKILISAPDFTVLLVIVRRALTEPLLHHLHHAHTALLTQCHLHCHHQQQQCLSQDHYE